MKAKNTIVTYALVGLAAGTIAWLLLGTKGEAHQLKCAGDSIRDLSDKVRKSTKDGIEQLSRFAERATTELEHVRADAKSTGQAALRKADKLAKKGISKTEQAIEQAKSKAQEI